MVDIHDFSNEFLMELSRMDKKNPDSIDKLKRTLVRKYSFDKFPANYEILVSLSESERAKYSELLPLLKTKPTRTLSGVAPLAVMTYPFACPHGKCITCPGGPKSEFGNVPQSYTGMEPAAMRGKKNNYDPYLQIFSRLKQYALLGHKFQKVELIVMGGTFLSFSKIYKNQFVYYLFRALNDFSKIFFDGNDFNFESFVKFFGLREKEDEATVKRKMLGLKFAASQGLRSEDDFLNALKVEQQKNETSAVRAVAFCVETRPDYCMEKDVNEMLDFGVTRVEIGVQSVFDDVLDAMNRGHSVADTAEATKCAKDSFLKVTYHMMPGLPGSDIDKDYRSFEIIFSDERFKPDALKIYPTLVIRGTKLWDMWHAGDYEPLTLEKAMGLLIRVKQIVPKYCRIMRIQRDIPSNIPDAGIKVSNLRQIVDMRLDEALGIQKRYVQKEISDEDLLFKLKDIKSIIPIVRKGKLHSCQCIRCREISRLKKVPKEIKPVINYIRYKASGGEEVFIEISDKDSDGLIGFVRLRKPDKPFRPEIGNAVGIRELHVYGISEALEDHSSESMQHHGFGKMLVAEAERIAKEEFHASKILVISGIGVKKYYEKLGYVKDGVYMSKSL